MRLTSLTVTNHSRLADFTIGVRKHLVLVGPNDVGKSSLLRCFDLLLGASTAALYARLGISDLRDATLPLVIEGSLEAFEADDRALFPDEIDIAAATGLESMRIRLEVIADAEETLDVRRTAPTSGTGRQLSRDQVAGLKWRMLGAIGSSRDLRDDRRNPLDDILQAVDLGPEKADFEALTLQLESKLSGSPALEALRDQLAAQLSKALPDALDKSDLAFVPDARIDDDALSGIQLRVNRGGMPRGLMDQSDGTRALFAMAMYDLVSASANIVGIDEPEVHLHPTSQRTLAKLLQDGSNQKILATHSSDIVSAFDPECVATVKAGGEIVQPTTGFLSKQEKLVLRWWVHGRLEPLTARRVLAVEGISDRIIVERVAELTGRDLDRLGVSVVETLGSLEMGPFVKLFGPRGFDIPISILIDKDAEGTTASSLGINVADLNAHSVWVSSPDLEAEYVAALGATQVWSALRSSGLLSANQLANCATNGAGGEPNSADLEEFCGEKKHKVFAAMSILPLLTAVNTSSISSVTKLLDEIVKP